MRSTFPGVLLRSAPLSEVDWKGFVNLPFKLHHWSGLAGASTFSSIVRSGLEGLVNLSFKLHRWTNGFVHSLTFWMCSYPSRPHKVRSQRFSISRHNRVKWLGVMSRRVRAPSLKIYLASSSLEDVGHFSPDTVGCSNNPG